MSKKHLFVLMMVGVSLGAGYYLLKRIEILSLVQLRFQTIIYLLILFITSTLVYLLANIILLRGMGYEVVPKDLYLVLHSSFAVNYMAPVKIGIPLRIYLYKKALSIPLSVGTASVAITNFLWIFLLSIISLVGIVNIFHEHDYTIIPLFFAIAIVLMVFLAFLPISNPDNVLSFLPFKNETQRLLAFVGGIQSGIKQVSKLCLIGVSALILMKLLITAYSSQLILQDLGYNISTSEILYAQSVALTLGFISMIPLGLGSKDVTLVFLLVEIGVTKEVAMSLAIIERVIWTLLPFMLGMICANALGIRTLYRRT